MPSITYRAETAAEAFGGLIAGLCACCNGTFPPPPGDCCEDNCPPVAWPHTATIKIPYGNTGPGGTPQVYTFIVPIAMVPPGGTSPSGTVNNSGCNVFEGDVTVTPADAWSDGVYAVLSINIVVNCFCCPFLAPGDGGPAYFYKCDLLTDCPALHAFWVAGCGATQTRYVPDGGGGYTPIFEVVIGGQYAYHDQVGSQTVGATVDGTALEPGTCQGGGTTGGGPCNLTIDFIPS